MPRSHETKSFAVVTGRAQASRKWLLNKHLPIFPSWLQICALYLAVCKAGVRQVYSTRIFYQKFPTLEVDKANQAVIAYSQVDQPMSSKLETIYLCTKLLYFKSYVHHICLICCLKCTKYIEKIQFIPWNFSMTYFKQHIRQMWCIWYLDFYNYGQDQSFDLKAGKYLFIYVLYKCIRFFTL